MALRLDVKDFPEVLDHLKLTVPVRVLADHVEDRVDQLRVQLLPVLLLILTFKRYGNNKAGSSASFFIVS